MRCCCGPRPLPPSRSVPLLFAGCCALIQSCACQVTVLVAGTDIAGRCSAVASFLWIDMVVLNGLHCVGNDSPFTLAVLPHPQVSAQVLSACFDGCSCNGADRSVACVARRRPTCGASNRIAMGSPR